MEEQKIKKIGEEITSFEKVYQQLQAASEKKDVLTFSKLKRQLFLIQKNIVDEIS